jgi:hypothetical protein
VVSFQFVEYCKNKSKKIVSIQIPTWNFSYAMAK